MSTTLKVGDLIRPKDSTRSGYSITTGKWRGRIVALDPKSIEVETTLLNPNSTYDGIGRHYWVDPQYFELDQDANVAPGDVTLDNATIEQLEAALKSKVKAFRARYKHWE